MLLPMTIRTEKIFEEILESLKCELGRVITHAVCWGPGEGLRVLSAQLTILHILLVWRWMQHTDAPEDVRNGFSLLQGHPRHGLFLPSRRQEPNFLPRGSKVSQVASAQELISKGHSIDSYEWYMTIYIHI